LVFGIASLVSGNLFGIAWLIWSRNMRTTSRYQPRWMYWTHRAIVGVLLVALGIACWLGISAPEEFFQIRLWGQVIAEPPMWAAPLALLTAIAAYVLAWSASPVSGDLRSVHAQL
jgi:cytochrome bd-type quinol oxidase subunit 2